MIGAGEDAPMVIDVDEPTLELALAALEAEAGRRQKAATRAAGELEEDVKAGAVTDKRRSAVRITEVLMEANRLTRFARRLEEAFIAATRTPSETRPTRAESAAAEDPDLIERARLEAEALHRASSALDEDTPQDPIDTLGEEP